MKYTTIIKISKVIVIAILILPLLYTFLKEDKPIVTSDKEVKEKIIEVEDIKDEDSQSDEMTIDELSEKLKGKPKEYKFQSTEGSYQDYFNKKTRYPTKYDDYFKGTRKYLPGGIDWVYLRALTWQESRFNHRAISPVGAKGIGQFMPGTWKEMQARYGVVNVFDPKDAIRASALYLSNQYHFWKADRSLLDKRKLATANYNAGGGNVHKAQQLCNNVNDYYGIIECLPLVTKHHSKETIEYVELINYKWYPDMKRDLGH